MEKNIRLSLGALALAGFVLPLAVHVSALLGVDVNARLPGVWLLHVGILVVFLPLVIVLRRDFGAKPSFRQIAAALPRWVIAVGVLIFVYAFANFFLFMAGSEGGGPSIQNGKYVLLNHGTLIRELTASEYVRFQANIVRGFSGHWLVFYYFPAAFFLCRKADRSPRPTSPGDPV
jgi:hypothetical protein